MSEVVLEGSEPNGLAQMIAGLVEANTAADASKAAILERTRGVVQIEVPEAEVTIALKFVPGTLSITSEPVAGYDLRITTDAETLLSLSTVPLRGGLPDPVTADGRRVTGKLFTRKLRIGGLPFAVPLLLKLNRLLNVN